MREKHRLRMFENKVLRKLFAVKRDKITCEWRKLHNAELHAFNSSPNMLMNLKPRRLRWIGYVDRMEQSRNPCKVLKGKLQGKSPLGCPRRLDGRIILKWI